MIDWIKENILTIVFGCSTIVLAVLNLRYRIRDHNLRAEISLTAGSRVRVFFSRSAMLKYLLEMYDRAAEDDVIWGQCVGCSNYTKEVRNCVSSAASRGIRFKIILNELSNSSKELEQLYTPYKKAEIVYRPDNSLRIQGLTDSEIVLAFPALESYIGLVIKDNELVSIFSNWFQNRFDTGRKVEQRH